MFTLTPEGILLDRVAGFVALGSGCAFDALSHLGNGEHRQRVLIEIDPCGITSYDDVWNPSHKSVTMQFNRNIFTQSPRRTQREPEIRTSNHQSYESAAEKYVLCLYFAAFASFA